LWATGSFWTLKTGWTEPHQAFTSPQPSRKRPTVKEKEKVHGGYVVKTGPGYAIPDTVPEEPWNPSDRKDLKYIPLQASEGDYAIFLRESAVEIEFEGKKYLIVPHSAILALVRTDIVDES
jgi:co-chaperonin GroES (HSP10)